MKYRRGCACHSYNVQEDTNSMHYFPTSRSPTKLKAKSRPRGNPQRDKNRENNMYTKASQSSNTSKSFAVMYLLKIWRP